jgi:hypothetical protein
MDRVHDGNARLTAPSSMPRCSTERGVTSDTKAITTLAAAAPPLNGVSRNRRRDETPVGTPMMGAGRGGDARRFCLGGAFVSVGRGVCVGWAGRLCRLGGAFVSVGRTPLRRRLCRCWSPSRSPPAPGPCWQHATADDRRRRRRRWRRRRRRSRHRYTAASSAAPPSST